MCITDCGYREWTEEDEKEFLDLWNNELHKKYQEEFGQDHYGYYIGLDIWLASRRILREKEGKK